MNGVPEGFLQRFLFDELDIRGVAVRLQGCWQHLQAGRGYAPGVAELLGELAAVTALIGGQLKQPGRLTVQLQGQGPVSTLVMDCDQQLRMRGMARARADQRAAPLHDMLGDGRLVITLLPDTAHTPYQSLVPLDGTNLAEVFEHFLEQSEQQPSALWLAASPDCAAGLFLQKLPEADRRDPDGWSRVLQLAGTVTPAELRNLDTPTLLTRLFHEEIGAGGLRLFEPREVRHHCPRDPEKVHNLLISLGRAEVESILAEKGEVHIHDDICNHDYRFNEEDIARLFGAPPGRLH